MFSRTRTEWVEGVGMVKPMHLTHRRKSWNEGGFLFDLEGILRFDEVWDRDQKLELRQRDFSTSPEIDAGMDRTGMTVATIKDSRNCEGSVATSLQFFLPVRPMDDEDDDRATERPSGRSDHDRVTWWSKWPRPLFNPIRTRVYSWMPSRLVWKKCLSFTFISPKEKFPSKFW